MIERMRSVRKIVLAVLALVFVVLGSLCVSSMLAPSAWAGVGGGPSGAGLNSSGASSRDLWVLGDADANNIGQVESMFIDGNGTQGWAANADKGSTDNYYHPGGGIAGGWRSAFTDPKDNFSGKGKNIKKAFRKESSSLSKKSGKSRAFSHKV